MLVCNVITLAIVGRGVKQLSVDRVYICHKVGFSSLFMQLGMFIER